MKMLFTGLENMTSWHTIQTRFGNVSIDDEGNVHIDNGIWEKMLVAFNQLNQFEGKIQNNSMEVSPQ